MKDDRVSAGALDRGGRFRIWGLLFQAAAIVSCSGGGGGIPIGDLPRNLVESVCAIYVRCGQFFDKATCSSSIRPNLDQLSADVVSGTVKYNAEMATRCVSSLGSSAFASCSRSVQAESIELEECKDVFVGTAAPGAACFVGQECVSSRCDRSACLGTEACCPGVCLPGASADATRPAALGQVCSPTSAGCVVEAYCKVNATAATPGAATGICTARIAVGQPCDTWNACVPGSICPLSPGVGAPGTSGTCRRLAAEGQACDLALGDSTCDSSVDYCDGTTAKCTPKVGVGGDCSAGKKCAAYTICDPATTLCVARKAAGTPCEPSDPIPCLGSLLCIEGQCALSSAMICP